MLMLHIDLLKPVEPKQIQEILKLVDAMVPAGGPEGICLSGRLPVWLFGALVHHFHPRPYVCVFDPRLGGVVVATHSTQASLGDVLPLDGAKNITLAF